MRKCLILSVLALLGVVLILSPVAAQQPPGSGIPGPGSPKGAPPKAGSLMPEDVFTPIAKGYDFIREGNWDAAEYQFADAVKRDPLNPFALNNLASIQAQKGKLKDALAYLKDATTYADNYKDKVEQTCFVAGTCMAVKPVRVLGPTSTVAPIIQDNIKKVEAKIAATPMPPQPSTPPPMK